MRTRFRSDRGLTIRMVATVFLLGLVYVAFIAALVAVRAPWLLVLVVAVGFFLVQYFFSDRLVLRMYRASLVTEAEAPELYGIVNRLRQRAGLPMPKLAIAPHEQPNAFATGHRGSRDPQDDASAITDIDLTILGAERARFDEYEADIRREYAFVPEDQFRRRRREILQSFLARPAIYATPWFHERYEARARENLSRSIGALT